MAKEKRIRTPSVHIVLDTNALFTDAADKLIALELSNFIFSGIKDLGLDVRWYLPAVVKAERHSQMLERGIRLLGPIEKLEALLGHKLNMTAEILEMRVVEAIKRQMELHRLNEISLDPARVDWNSLIHRAVLKRPPFSPGDKEKGFKDAVVLETFMQLVEDLPKSPSSCRIVLLTNDELLAIAAKERTEQLVNTTVISELTDLRSLMNAIASHLPDEAVKEIISKAKQLFFVVGSEETLYFKWSIGEKVKQVLADANAPQPGEGFSVVTRTVFVHSPTFMKKVGQKITFADTIKHVLEATKKVPKYYPATSSSQSPGSLVPESGTLTLRKSSDTPSGLVSASEALNRYFEKKASLQAKVDKPAGLLANLFDTSETIYEEVTRSGSHVFQITWEATLNQRGALTSPKLISVEYESTLWDQ